MTLYEFITQKLQWKQCQVGIVWESNDACYWNDVQSVDWDLIIVESTSMESDGAVEIHAATARACHPEAVIRIEKLVTR